MNRLHILLCLGCLVLFGHGIASAEDSAADTPASDTPPSATAENAANEAVREYTQQFKGRGAVGDFATKPLSPQASRDRFQVPDDLQVDVALHEPEVRQPVCINFDERGRMWVMQYLQYPFPAGLKVVSYDEHLRAVFDKVPEPPPHGTPGADMVTIHEDTDGDGTYDTHKTFVDGLNIATSALPGRGGVWVMNPPYLLFYPDANRDDIPDSDPEVHLAGFGLEDTHAVANSLTWGPDGWLYGAQGSTCWASVIRPGLDTEPTHFKGQAIWRYHPRDKRFEVFAEGGGNTFSIEFDAKGRLYSGHNGGNTRGFHYVQGGYYYKSFGKHGALTNPYTYGYFPSIAHHSAQRFSHTLIRYEGNLLPEKYQGKLFAPVPLHNYMALASMKPMGSTWQTEDAEKPILETDDTWFRPVDIKAGPDGAIYLVDWYDTRLTHVDPRDTWDRGHGRIWRLRPHEYAGRKPFNYGEASLEELQRALKSANKWDRQLAQRVFADRKDPRYREPLRAAFDGADGQFALELLWAIHASGGLDESFAQQTLQDEDPYVRLWTVRLLGDDRQVSDTLGNELLRLASREHHPEVLSQIACTAKRLPGDLAIGLVESLSSKDKLMEDPHLPLLCWWALEDKAMTHTELALATFNTAEAWQRPLVRDILLPNLVQRLAAERTTDSLTAVAQVMRTAPSDVSAARLFQAVSDAFYGRTIENFPQPLVDALVTVAARLPKKSLPRLSVMLRAGDAEARETARSLVANAKHAQNDRIELMRLLAETGDVQSAPVLLEQAKSAKQAKVREEAIGALRHFTDVSIGKRLLEVYANEELPAETRPMVIDVLASRRPWALALLQEVKAERLPRSEVPPDVVERMRLFDDEQIDRLATEVYGSTRATSSEMQAEMKQVAWVLANGTGDAKAGKKVYTEACGKCHKLFGEGKEIGPDLTGYERTNNDFLLLSIIDPSAAIREEYTQFQVLTVDGLIVSGFIRERGDQTLTMQNGEGATVVLSLEDIDDGPKAVDKSLMPDRLLSDLSAQQIRDLFAYLQSSGKPASQPVSTPVGQ